MRIKFKPRAPWPKQSETRTRHGFLWLPKKIGNELRWLETAYWEEMYIDVCWYNYWEATKWLESYSANDEDI